MLGRSLRSGEVWQAMIFFRCSIISASDTLNSVPKKWRNPQPTNSYEHTKFFWQVWNLEIGIEYGLAMASSLMSIRKPVNPSWTPGSCFAVMWWGRSRPHPLQQVWCRGVFNGSSTTVPFSPRGKTAPLFFWWIWCPPCGFACDYAYLRPSKTLTSALFFGSFLIRSSNVFGKILAKVLLQKTLN